MIFNLRNHHSEFDTHLGIVSVECHFDWPRDILSHSIVFQITNYSYPRRVLTIIVSFILEDQVIQL